MPIRAPRLDRSSRSGITPGHIGLPSPGTQHSDLLRRLGVVRATDELRGVVDGHEPGPSRAGGTQLGAQFPQAAADLDRHLPRLAGDCRLVNGSAPAKQAFTLAADLGLTGVGQGHMRVRLRTANRVRRGRLGHHRLGELRRIIAGDPGDLGTQARARIRGDVEHRGRTDQAGLESQVGQEACPLIDTGVDRGPVHELYPFGLQGNTHGEVRTPLDVQHGRPLPHGRRNIHGLGGGQEAGQPVLAADDRPGQSRAVDV